MNQLHYTLTVAVKSQIQGGIYSVNSYVTHYIMNQLHYRLTSGVGTRLAAQLSTSWDRGFYLTQKLCNLKFRGEYMCNTYYYEPITL